MGAAHALIHGNSWGALIGYVLVGTVFGAVGLAMATNFRGVTERHVRMTFRFIRPAERPVRRIPPWRQMLAQPVEQRIAKQIRLERWMGVTFALVGALAIVVGLAGMVRHLL